MVDMSRSSRNDLAAVEEARGHCPHTALGSDPTGWLRCSELRLGSSLPAPGVASTDRDPGVMVKLLVPADHHDQHDCGGGNRQQYGHAGGLCPTGLGCPSDLVDQAGYRAASRLVIRH
jgi:hypothetical protein